MSKILATLLPASYCKESVAVTDRQQCCQFYTVNQALQLITISSGCSYLLYSSDILHIYLNTL